MRRLLQITWMILIIVSMLANIAVASPAQAAAGSFDQGAGFQQGAYQLGAVQPTAFNWSRQSQFNGPEEPVKRWECIVKSRMSGGELAPVIDSTGTIYIGSSDYKLYAINKDGSTKWAFKTNGFIDSSPCIAADGTVYVGSNDHNLYAINPDGTEKWRFETDGIVRSSPALAADGTVYAGSYDNKFYAINNDGTLKWEFVTGSHIESSPVIGADGTIYIGSEDRNLYALNPDGSKKWNNETDGSIVTNPVIGQDGTIYVISSSYLHAINSNGTEQWQYGFGMMGMKRPAPVIGLDGTIYVSYNGLHAINRDGTIKWYDPHLGYVQSPIIGADGTLYVGSYDKSTYSIILGAINPDGSKQWEYDTGDNINHCSPAIDAEGTLYVTSDANKLYAIGDASSASAKSQSAAAPLNNMDTNQSSGSSTSNNQTSPNNDKAVFTIGSDTFLLNGMTEQMEVPPYIKAGRTFIPIRYAAYALGISETDIIWDGGSQSVTLSKGGKAVKLFVGDNVCQVNGVPITMDAAPEIIEGRVCLPIAFVVQAFEGSTAWDEKSRSVSITG